MFFFQIVFSQEAIYVSTNGNDNNKGLENSPVYSLQRAFDLSKNKNTKAVDIKISGGNYFYTKPLVINNEYSRTEKTKIKVIGDKKNRPILFGGNRLVPILDKKSGEWIIQINKDKTKTSGEFIQILSINGEGRRMSKFPSTNFMKPLSITYQNGSFTVGIPKELNELLKTYSNENIKNVFATFYVKWSTVIRYIDKHNYLESTLTFKGENIPELFSIEANKTFFSISNIKKKLEPGEWYYKNSNTIIYQPKKNESIKTAILVIPHSKEFINIEGNINKNVSFIDFENIILNTGGNGLDHKGYFPYQAAVTVESVINLEYSDNVNFTNMFFKNINSNVFWIKDGCRFINISQNTFSNLSAGAVKIGNTKYISDNDITNNVKIYNNVFNNGGNLYPDAVPVLILDSHSNTVSHNTISDFMYTGISVGWVWGYGKSSAYNNTISYNHIYNLGKGILDDMGGIYTLGISKGTKIENNLIHDIKSNNYGGWGIYTDEGSTGIEIKNNLVYNCSSSGFHQHYGKDNLIENNIFAFNNQGELEATRVENHLSLTFRNNIVVHQDDKIFRQNWEAIQKNTGGNIYYIPGNGKNENLYKNEVHFYMINPELEKKKSYYIIKNEEVFKQTEFKKIDFSNVGALQ